MTLNYCLRNEDYNKFANYLEQDENNFTEDLGKEYDIRDLEMECYLMDDLGEYVVIYEDEDHCIPVNEFERDFRITRFGFDFEC